RSCPVFVTGLAMASGPAEDGGRGLHLHTPHLFVLDQPGDAFLRALAAAGPAHAAAHHRREVTGLAAGLPRHRAERGPGRATGGRRQRAQARRNRAATSTRQGTGSTGTEPTQRAHRTTAAEWADQPGGGHPIAVEP